MPMDPLEQGFQEALNRASSGESASSKDFKMTQDEVKKFQAAFKKKEFRDLFSDYVKEISDPKNREEYETYLRQAEAQNKVPQGSKLVRPEAGFVIKTFRSRTSEEEEEEEAKVYNFICLFSINILIG